MATFTPQEQQAFKYLFDLADTEQLGVLTGDKAVGFLSKSKLPIETLGEVWQLSDSENNGFLTPEGFSLACRLIGHAQQGEAVSEELTRKPSQLPVFEGVTLPGAPASSAQPPSVVALAPVTVQDKGKFMRLFLGSGPIDGLLDGDKARDIFIKSNLPFEQLGHIWNLADTKQRGSLDATDFVIGMHLLDLTMSGRLPNGKLPDTLPPGFYETAVVPAAGPNTPLQQQTTGTLQPQHSGSPAASRGSILKPQSTGDRPVARQHTGQKVSFGPTPPTSASPGSMAFARPAALSQPWDISSEEKARSDGFFDQLDGRRAGYVEGDQAVPFFLESRLPEANLAQIWDLSDISKQGRLSKDEFAVAMRLINDQLDGKPVPTELPASLVPPSLRSGAASQAAQASAPAPQPAGVERDLFSLMDEPEETPAPISAASPIQAVSPQVTGRRSPAPQAGLTPQGTGNTSVVSPQITGNQASSTPTVSPPVQQPQQSFAPSRSGSTADDFFGDDGAAKVDDNSVELGQLRNAYNASSRGVSTLTTQREDMEKTASATSSEVEELKEKLRISRETFEKEQKLVQDLSIRAGDHRKELQQAKQQLITAESELSGLKVEKSEAEQGLMRDKEEIRLLKAKLAEMSKETVGLKAEIEKLKKDGRQQKGMLAISKKQLASAEGDHEKATKELEALKLEPEASAPSTPDLAAAAALPASQGPSQVTSPAGSVRSTNPFDRFMSKPMSPQITGSSQVSKKSPLAQPSALPTNENPSTLPTMAAGAALGAVGAGVVGAGALAASGHSEELSSTPEAEKQQPAQSDDPFAPSDQNKQSEDPFSAGSPDPSGPAQTFDSAFDDNFDNSFAQPAVAVTNEPSSANFDDAFTGFDQGSTPAAEPSSAVSSPPEQPTVDRSAAAAEQPLATQDKNDDAESSAEEDEGPEDLDQPSRSKTPQMPGAFGAELDNPNDALATGQVREPPSSVVPEADEQATSARPSSNDFDSDFVDLAPSTTAAAGPSADDKFDDDFNMDDFGAPTTSVDDAFGVPPATSQSQSTPRSPPPAFDDAFGSDNFAPSNAGAAASSSQAVPAVATNNGFDDEFDSAFKPASPSGTGAPAPAASPALTGDSPAVQELTGMGFGRTAVADALKNNGNDRERALNALLDKSE